MINHNDHLDRKAILAAEGAALDRHKQHQVTACLREMQDGATEADLRNQNYAEGAILAAKARLDALNERNG